MDPPWSVTAAPEVALILAAGLGSRLRAQTKTPKPLIRVLGLTLAERVVCTLLGAGVQRFLVILGHEAESITAHFADIAQRRGVTIEFVEAKDWELGNGASAHAAATDGGERWSEAEIHRIKGEILCRSGDWCEAETCFLKAIEVAVSRAAKSFELRAATSLARLWHQHGKSAEARERLAPVYGWFTEGFETPDLREAEALLEELN